MLASRFSSLRPVNSPSCRGSWPNARTIRTPDSVSWRYEVIEAIFSLVIR